jgi:hypothetical protein
MNTLGPIAQLAEHRADNAGVTGAIPVRPTIILDCRGRSSAGRASDLHSEGRRFDPGRLQGSPRHSTWRPVG